jgi:hypothetical protein
MRDKWGRPFDKPVRSHDRKYSLIKYLLAFK